MNHLKTLFIFLCGALAGVIFSALSKPDMPMNKQPPPVNTPSSQEEKVRLDNLCRALKRHEHSAEYLDQQAVITCLRRELMSRNVQLVKLHKRTNRSDSLQF